MSDEAIQTTQIIGERSAIFGLARGRLSFISTAFLILYLLVAARLTDLAVVQGTLLQIGQEYASEEKPQVLSEALPRHGLYDRNGVLLATSLTSQSLFADPALIDDPKEVASELIKIFPELVPADLIKKLSEKSRFVWIKRNITPEAQAAVLSIGEPGLSFMGETRRIYPQGALASHLIGYTNIDGDGLAGAERAFNKDLAQKDVYLSLDIRLQHILEKELAAASLEFKAEATSGLIMDVRNGEVLAGASWPDFDPNHAGQADKNNLFNRLTLGVYELGSMFKIFTTAAFLDEGNPIGTRLDATNSLKRGRFTIRDYHPEKRVMTVPEVFMHSSNIGTALMSEKIGTDGLRKFFDKLGLLSLPEFEVKELGAPIVPNPWRPINTLTASYGHGVAVSPLQLGTAVASIINDGTFVKATLLKGGGNNKKLHERIVSPKTVEAVRQLMRLTVTDGTGSNAEISGYQIGGKTGTADKPGPRGGYEHNKKISSFVGAFPMDNPRYLVLVVVDNPVGNKRTYNYATGGWVAAPASKNIIQGMTRILGIKPEQIDDRKLIEPLKPYLQEEMASADH